jgi:ATP-dependent RNA helicase SUPV3L1/SUV3
MVLWRGEAAGMLTSDQPFNPTVRLFGELGAGPALERAARRMEAFVAAESGRRLGALAQLSDAVASGAIRGLARGLAYRLIEAGGVIDRRGVQSEIWALSQGERRALRRLGVRIGAFCLYLPSQLEPDAAQFAAAFAAQAAPTRALGLSGRLSVGALAVPVAALERLDEALRQAPRRGEGAVLSDPARETLGWSAAQANQILRGLGFTPADRPRNGEPTAWRRRRIPVAQPPRGYSDAVSPFSALAALKTAPAPRRRKRPPRKHA